jgi:hypothetical protein
MVAHWPSFWGLLKLLGGPPVGLKRVIALNLDGLPTDSL